MLLTVTCHFKGVCQAIQIVLSEFHSVNFFKAKYSGKHYLQPVVCHEVVGSVSRHEGRHLQTVYAKEGHFFCHNLTLNPLSLHQAVSKLIHFYREFC